LMEKSRGQKSRATVPLSCPMVLHHALSMPIWMISGTAPLTGKHYSDKRRVHQIHM
jgi:hypothetical protein